MFLNKLKTGYKVKINYNLIITFVGVAVILIFAYLANQTPAKQSITIGYSEDTVKAEVVSILEQGTVQLGEVNQTFQVAKLRVLEGDYQGHDYTIEYGKNYIYTSDYLLKPGEEIYVSVGQMPDGETSIIFIDFVRTNALLILGLVFVLVCVLVSGWKGVRSLIGIGVSVLVIIFFIIPQILKGQNPILISLIGSIFFLAVTQYLVFGWTLKTHISIFSILICILITGIIAFIFVDLAHLNGMGDENSMYILQKFNYLNVKNLLIAGIIIGSLGLLDDLVVGQTSAVIEIYRADPEMKFTQRLKRAMNIGRDHVAATVNTLVLAYLGASISLFLLFSNSNTPVATILNFNYLAEAIVRSLVGTIGLFISVPVTTVLACWVVDDYQRLGKFVRIFGPLLNSSEAHHE